MTAVAIAEPGLELRECLLFHRSAHAIPSSRVDHQTEEENRLAVLPKGVHASAPLIHPATPACSMHDNPYPIERMKPSPVAVKARIPTLFSRAVRHTQT